MRRNSLLQSRHLYFLTVLKSVKRGRRSNHFMPLYFPFSWDVGTGYTITEGFPPKVSFFHLGVTKVFRGSFKRRPVSETYIFYSNRPVHLYVSNVTFVSIFLPYDENGGIRDEMGLETGQKLVTRFFGHWYRLSWVT